jgi:potassium uptake TrkH family protein
MTTRSFGGRRQGLRHPAQYIVATFFAVTVVGTALLMLPAASRSHHGATFTTALFTSASATCVTGLAVVDTEGHWTVFGQVVMLALMQIGGLGAMTLTSLIVLGLSRRLGIRQMVLLAAETGSLRLGDVKALVFAILRLTLVVEAVVAAVLVVRFWTAHDESIGRAAYLGVFHSVSSFNNAGFALFPDGLVPYQGDAVVLGAIAVAVIAGGLGFPVWRQLRAAPRRPRQWDLHTKITVLTTIALIVVGWALFLWFEWGNPSTMGPLATGDKISNGFFQSVVTRSAGLHSIDIGAMDDTSHLLTMILMFIGGGSGSTAGGIKVTTFAVLGWIIWAEVRGERDVDIFRRRLPVDAQRQALSVALLAVGGLVASTMLLLAVTDFVLADVAFESVSALGTVGLSTGITPSLPTAARLVVVALMFVGRVGPPTLFAALVLRNRERLYRHPEERVIIG